MTTCDSITPLNLKLPKDKNDDETIIQKTVSQNINTTESTSPKEKTPKTQKKKSSPRNSSKLKKKLTNENDLIKYIRERLPQIDEYLSIEGKVGEGTFSAVFLASLKSSPIHQFAIKYLTPGTTPLRMETELKCMLQIGGQDNVVRCYTCLRNLDTVVFIMPYIEHPRFLDYVHQMGVEETRLYMKNLLIALRRVHSFNVIHRDVKPSNFLYDRKNKKFLLVDFGLSHFLKNVSPNNKMKTPSQANNHKRKRTEDISSLSENPSKRLALAPRPDESNLIKASPNKTNEKKDLENAKSPITTANSTSLTTSGRENNPFPELSTFGKPIKRRLVFPESTITSSAAKTNSTCTNNITEVQPPPATKNITFQKLTPGVNLSGRTHLRLQNGEVQLSFYPPTTANPSNRPQTGLCKCFGLPQVCNKCILNHQEQHAPRAGTPGFRPPEVLLRCRNQTTAVDMWAAGVILLCILSGRYPYFRALTDPYALAEIVTIFGYEQMKKAASTMGQKFLCSEKKCIPKDLRKLCQRLRNSGDTTQEKCSACKNLFAKDGSCICLPQEKIEKGVSYSSFSEGDTFPDAAYDLLTRLMALDPRKRITAAEALEHPFILGSSS